MKIRTKLLGGIVFIILIFVGGNIFTLTKIAVMKSHAKEIVDNSIPAFVVVGAINENISIVARSIEALPRESNQQIVDQIEKNLNDLLQNIENQRKRYEVFIGSPEEKLLFDNFTSNWNEYKTRLPDIISDVKINNQKIAFKEIEAANNSWNAASIKLGEIIKVNEKKANIATQGSLNSAGTAIYLTIILSVVSTLLGIIFSLLLTFYISKSLGILRKELTSLTENGGDLTQTIPVTSKDEIGDLAKATNRFIANLRVIIAQVIHGAKQVSESSSQLSISSEQVTMAVNHVASAVAFVAKGSEEQVSQVNEATAAIEEMSAGIQQVASNSDSVSRLAEKTASATDHGRRAVNNTIKQMNSIGESSYETKAAIEQLVNSSIQIGEIVNIISGIADQTNLLALNAAIEAARAGEQGRGFAVVADEVRKLAEQSQGAAKQITVLINQNHKNIQNAVNSTEVGANSVRSGIEVVDAANKAFEEISALVDGVSKQISEISTGIVQIAMVSQGIVTSMESVAVISRETALQTETVSASTEEQSATMEEIAASSQSLAQMAEELQYVVDKFKV